MRRSRKKRFKRTKLREMVGGWWWKHWSKRECRKVRKWVLISSIYLFHWGFFFSISPANKTRWKKLSRRSTHNTSLIYSLAYMQILFFESHINFLSSLEAAEKNFPSFLIKAHLFNSNLCLFYLPQKTKTSPLFSNQLHIGSQIKRWVEWRGRERCTSRR